MTTPVRFLFESMGVSPERIAPNTESALARGIPLVQPAKAHDRKLAVVGSGPSLRHHLKSLRKWKGDIWAINGTVKYLHDNGIKSTLISVDPGERKDYPRVLQAKDALLAVVCDPVLFDAYEGRVKGFFISPDPRAPFEASGGCTTACRAPMLAIQMGYRDITFYGCEGSYEGDTHVYADFKDEGPLELYVEEYAGGKGYRCCVEGLMQSQYLSDLIRKFPQGFREKCGGLLRVMLEHPDTWTMAQVSGALKDRLEQSFARQQGTQQGAQL